MPVPEEMIRAMVPRRLRRRLHAPRRPGGLAAVALAAVAAVAVTPAPSGPATGPATGASGAVRFFQSTGPSFDAYTTNATPRFHAWMRRHSWRALTYSPYFDDKTRWY